MTVIDLSNRSTTSKKIPEIDSLYCYATRHKIKLTHRNQIGAGYRYTNHNAVLTAGENEINIYHRSATIGGVTKGLTLVTKNGKFREVQRFINEQIKAIDSDDTLFDVFSHVTTTPKELGLYFTY